MDTRFDIDAVVFDGSNVCQAVGLVKTTVSQWVSRGVVSGTAAEVAPGSGRTRRYSLRDAIHLGIVADFTAFGIRIGIATSAAAQFTMVGLDRPAKHKPPFDRLKTGDFDVVLLYRSTAKSGLELAAAVPPAEEEAAFRRLLTAHGGVFRYEPGPRVRAVAAYFGVGL